MTSKRSIIFSLAVFVIALWPSHYPYSQTPKVQPQHQAENGINGGSPSEHGAAPQINPSGEQQHERAGDYTSEFAPLGVKPGEWLLSIVTLMLWGATVRLVRGSEDSSKRQLRAYISESGFLIKLEKGIFYFRMVLHNTGQTPAYAVKAWMAPHLIDLTQFSDPIPVLIEQIKIKEATIGLFTDTVGPKVKFIISSEANIARPDMPSNMLDLIIRGEYALFIYGALDYRDAFKKSHPRTFIRRIQQSGGDWVAKPAQNYSEPNE